MNDELQAIENRRRKVGISTRHLERVAGISAGYYWRLLNKHCPASSAVMRRLERALDELAGLGQKIGGKKWRGKVNSGRGDLGMVKAMLQERCLDVCRALLPGGKIEGRLYVAHDPVVGDWDRKPALKVRLTGNIGGWAAFRGEARTARHDILGLIEYIRGGDVADALRWAVIF